MWFKTAELLSVHLNVQRTTLDAEGTLPGFSWFHAPADPEERYRPHIDGICQDFIFSRAWPIMTVIEARLVANRLAWAIRLALSLHTPFLVSNQARVSFPKHLDDAQVLHWLLIDTWSPEPSFETGPGEMEDVGVSLRASIAISNGGS